jgi:hypothetical protein
MLPFQTLTVMSNTVKIVKIFDFADDTRSSGNFQNM